uniref:Ribosomal RNA-processing protein 8 n=1 Tax=Mesocestoides corti TaxID=53468 RepID=A0A5K3ET12_MESCO
MDSSFLEGLKAVIQRPELAVKKKPKRKQKVKCRKKLANATLSTLKHSNRTEYTSDTLESEIQASMFRILNEKLYNCSSTDASQYFSEDPFAFEVYHKGFQKQLSKWPSDPLDWPEKIIKSDFKKSIVADMGCGDARLALHLKGVATVHSFDLVAVNERVTVCDMAHTPLNNSSVDVVLFCLALMGTNCRDFIYEANRILKMNGTLLIVEVASRFDASFKRFLKLLKPFGFKVEKWEITEDSYFAHGRLCKVKDLSSQPVSTMPTIAINPCLYKKR